MITPRMLILAATLLVAGCNAMGSGSSGSSSAPQGSSQVAGIALPSGYSVDQGQTVVVGEGDRWTGRFVYTINSGAGDMLEFYRSQMAGLGWAEVAVARAETSVLTYSSASTARVATVQITPRTLFGSRVTITVSPASGAPAPALSPAPLRSSDAQQPPPPAVPRGNVSTQPLR